MKQYNGLMSCMDAIVLEMNSYIHKNNQSHEKVGKIIFLTPFLFFLFMWGYKGEKSRKGLKTGGGVEK